jgi:hypothetical protein
VRLQFAAVLFALAIGEARAQMETSRFGLVYGRSSVYVGTARWTGDGKRVHSTSVVWPMDILQVRASSDTRGALVRGWIQELAWYTPGQRPAFSVLFEHRGHLYHLTASDSAAAVDSLTVLMRDPASAATHAGLIVDSSLVIGRIFGGDPDRGQRNDALYAWQVDSKEAFTEAFSRRAQWSALVAEPTRWRIAYRTLPDEQVIDFIPGVGISGFVYVHHGTTATVDVHLSTVTSSRG